jgi:hypothetical protein
MITICNMVEALKEFDGKYLSIACFANAVEEVLALAGRQNTTTTLVQSSPGCYRAVLPEEGSFVLQVRQCGVAELFPWLAPPLPDVVPYASLAVQRAEELCPAGVSYLGLLKRTRGDKGWGACFVLDRQNGSWDAYTDGLVPWVKRCLWTEGLDV